MTVFFFCSLVYILCFYYLSLAHNRTRRSWVLVLGFGPQLYYTYFSHYFLFTSLMIFYLIYHFQLLYGVHKDNSKVTIKEGLKIG